MNILDIIDKKKNKKNLTKEEITFVIDEYVKGNIEDYQISALLMAICINGMTNDEIFYLTEAMLNSGDILNLSELKGITVDKHSTGGIGDKTTLIVAPLVAACNVDVAKMSGKGLGFTGGTIDKLESIPGFNVNLSTVDFMNQVKNIGVCICYGNKNLVPADKKIYAIRDVTSTVDSIPLIASSIMSKKLACGCNKIVIDLKVGNGAFMKSIDDATQLAKLMIEIGKYFGKEVLCILSNMNEPLGNSIGNALEVQEALETLKGKGPEDLTRLCLYIASYMVLLSKNMIIEDAMKLVSTKLYDGSAYNKFLEMVKYQNGNIDDIYISKNRIDINSKEVGFITDINALKLGEISCMLGAGRQVATDIIDSSVGLVIHKKVGDIVNVGTPLVSVYYNKTLENIEKEIYDCFTFNKIKKDKEPLVYKIIK